MNAELVWSSKPPTAPGWYWWRLSPRDFDPEIERWEMDNDGVLRVDNKPGRDSVESTQAKFPEYQWSDRPIPAPSEPRS